MASNRSTKAKRASAADPRELRALQRAAELRDAEISESAPAPSAAPAAAPIDSTEEATGRPAQRAAIEQAMARHNVRQNAQLERSPGAVGPIGRALLLVALLTLVGLLAVWVLIAL